MTTTEPSLGRALGAVADAAIEQARDLTVAQLDRWAGQLHERLGAMSTHQTSAAPGTISPLIIGALAGAAVAWLVVDRRREE
jgi:glycerol uptake facilitator-like aquaporin